MESIFRPPMIDERVNFFYSFNSVCRPRQPVKIDFENDTQRTVLTDENGTQTLINSYSVASGVLVSDLVNMEKMENRTLMNLKRILNDCRSVSA